MIDLDTAETFFSPEKGGPTESEVRFMHNGLIAALDRDDGASTRCCDPSLSTCKIISREKDCTFKAESSVVVPPSRTSECPHATRNLVFEW